MSPREERVTDQTKARKALYRNGWVVGTLVAFVIIIVFVACFRDVSHLTDILLLVWAPIGIAVGAVFGLAVEGPTLPRRTRDTIALSIIVGFAAYIVVLVFCLMYRV
jgi:hypothetical protein